MASRAAVVRCSEVARRRARRGRGPSEAKRSKRQCPSTSTSTSHTLQRRLLAPALPLRGRRRRRCLGEGRAFEAREARRERHREWGLQGVGAAGWCVPCSTPACFQPPPPLARLRQPRARHLPPRPVLASGGPKRLQGLGLGSVGPRDRVGPTPELLEPCRVVGGVGVQPGAPSACELRVPSCPAA